MPAQLIFDAPRLLVEVDVDAEAVGPNALTYLGWIIIFCPLLKAKESGEVSAPTTS